MYKLQVFEFGTLVILHYNCTCVVVNTLQSALSQMMFTQMIPNKSSFRAPPAPSVPPPALRSCVQILILFGNFLFLSWHVDLGRHGLFLSHLDGIFCFWTNMGDVQLASLLLHDSRRNFFYILLLRSLPHKPIPSITSFIVFLACLHNTREYPKCFERTEMDNI